MREPRSLPVCEAVADAVVAAGVDAAFGLMGNGNMFVMDAIGKSVPLINVRHEHTAVTMADGYFRRTKRLAVALVTNGPGFTQVMTAVTVAARARTPVVVIAGDRPLSAPFHIHAIDQAPFALACGARYVAVRSPARLAFDLAEAFRTARQESVPVVVGIPEDMQHALVEWPSRPIGMGPVDPQPRLPDPSLIAHVAGQLRQARRPVILAGRGSVARETEETLVALADRSGALLSTTLLGKGLFDGHPWHLGVAGGLATPAARALLQQADLVLAFGASLGHYTTDGGSAFPNAHVIQFVDEGSGRHEGRPTADLVVLSDSGFAARALLEGSPRQQRTRSEFRTPDVKACLARGDVDNEPYPVVEGEIDPRQAFARLDAIIPKDWDIVCGLGHFFFFAMAGLTGRRPERYHLISEFGTVGSALAAALGVATSRPDGKVLVIDGDGSLMMHIQEIETAVRHRIRLLVCAMNDGAYGAELHKLRAKGLDPRPSLHGRCDLAAVARAFGAQAATVDDLGDVETLLAEYGSGTLPMVWDFKISDAVPARPYRFPLGS